MPAVQIVSATPGAGKSAVLVGLARGFANAGSKVRIERVGSGPAAEADAAGFGDFLFAASSGQALAQTPQAADGEVLLIEVDSGSTPVPGMPAIAVVKNATLESDATLATSLGETLIGSIATDVAPESVEATARDMTNAGLRPLALLPEDRVLAAPSVSELAQAANADLLHEAENADAVVEDVIIGPVYADPARPLFRRYAHKAILAPFNKTDLHLAAIETEAACLVITGGIAPSPYILDRARHGTTTLLLSPNDTPGTVASLGSMWSSTRFRGELKADAVLAALESRVDFEGLLNKIRG